MSEQIRRAWAPLPASRWDRAAAAHLLRRAGFGGTPDDLDQATSGGLDDTLDWLLAPPAAPDPVDDTTRALFRGAEYDKVESLQGRWVHKLIATPRPLEERLTLFWHSHFATGLQKVVEPSWMWRQNQTLRRHAYGPFRAMLRAISRDPAMIRYLDNDTNRKGHPNENYARELFELFGLGRGHYTEKDIAEAARAFTGWHIAKGEFVFRKGQHDHGAKTVFGQTGHFGGDQIVDLVLGRPQCARWLATKLFRHFAFEDAEPALVEPLAERIRADDYRLGGALRMLFASRVFHDAERCRLRLIKSPAEYCVGMLQSLLGRMRSYDVAKAMTRMGQNLFHPPNVKGWDGGRTWISSSALFERQAFARRVVGADGKSLGELTDLMRPLAEAGVTDAAATADFYCDRLLPGVPLQPAVRTRLRRYLAAPAMGVGRARRVAELVHLILSLPEYQLA